MLKMYSRLAVASAFLLLSFLASDLTAQSSLPFLELPALDNAALQAEEMALSAPGRPPRFAVPHDVDVRPTTHGEWTERGGTSVWRLGLRSPGAYSLNLGFTEYYLPPGAELSIYRGKGNSKTGPFTAADNELHKQLWTPLIPGEALVLELVVPTDQRSFVQLRLTKVNHDFGGLGLVASGSCNLDVACGTADGWDIVDRYRDIIQSTALYSLNGSITCSGALINNARQDCTPYFLAASHCGIQANSAPSIVVYWNFANSTCRQPNTTASGGNGDGSLGDFNSGAVLRADYPTSDFTLIELDDPVSETANAFFAGWDRRFAVPTDTVIAIHHPRLDEKRISFSFQDTYRVEGVSSNPVPEGSHIAVPSWDIGTTEGGSSGSPLFDRFKRIRGQLHGGAASCSSVDYDAYGFMARSWEGGGTPTTRLSDWLDPDNTGVSFIDGRSALACAQSVVAQPTARRICAGSTASYLLAVGGGYPEAVSLSTGTLPAGVTAAFSQNDVAAGTNLTLTLSTQATMAGGVFAIPILVTSGTEEQEFTVELTVEGDVASPPALLLPNNNATDIGVNTNLTWQTAAAASEYAFQLSTDADFTTLIATGTTASVSTVVSNLVSETIYFWRVRSLNTCGEGPWSVTRQFTTGLVSCAALPADNLPRNIPDDGFMISTLEVTLQSEVSEISINNLRIDHTYIGDLRVELTSPAQTTAVLFDRIGFPEAPFGCGGENVFLSFSDTAPQSAAQLEGSCDTDGIGAQGSYQPLDPFLAFAGEPTEGTWILRVFDNASEDTGRLIAWELNLCSTLANTDLGLSLVNAPISACAGTPVAIVLGVGAGFADDFSTSLLLNNNPFFGFTSSFDTENRELTIQLPTLVGFQNGANDIQVILTAEDGENANDIDLTLERVDAPLLPVLLQPEVGATVPPQQTIDYSWQAASGAEEYLIQFSASETFSTIISEATVTETTYQSLPPAGVDNWFWRVISTNDCGDGIAAGRRIALQTNNAVDLAGGTIRVLPNPTYGMLFLETSVNWSAPVSVRLFGTSGRVLRQSRLFAGPQRHELDLSSLPAGVYWLELRAAGERRMTKVVKLR